MNEKICFCCKKPAEFSILLAYYGERFYLPNQNVRELANTDPEILQEFWFCHPCMRTIEDNFRAIVNYLKSQNGPKFRKP